ncbi:MAG: MBL fold metallo-hydrolase [Desulfurivibrionaceae bacterium]|nr:MBL fold metallo-hydrolase [Desulfurivibrionaceae bacterium]
MTDVFKLGDFKVHWLEGGRFEIDGGSMFGVVPKVLWSKKCASTADNYVGLADSAILVQTPEGNILIDTGLGNKLSAKQKKIFRLKAEWQIPADLARLGLSRTDIHHVILTHADFDHAAGLTMHNQQGGVELTFPAAIHHMQAREWWDVCHPNRRSASSYWPENFQGLEEGGNLHLIDGQAEIVAGVRCALTGGHTRGHQVVWLHSDGETALHGGDLLPNTAYANPLWITAYDNFPLDSVAAKEKFLAQAAARDAWFLFYHDPDTLACKFSETGEVRQGFPVP